MKINYPLKRARPMTPKARIEFHQAIIAILEVQPRNTRYLADQFGITVQAMNKRLVDMFSLGMVHSSHVKGVGRKEPYMWYAGEGDALLLDAPADQSVGGEPKQKRFTTWPPVKIKPQHIWSAVMD